MPKTPFEIRADLLALAKVYLDRQYDINAQFAQQAFVKALEAGNVTVESWKDYIPAPYTVEELTKKAQEMYSFVNTK